ncbi:MAG: hypothetical protein AAB821_01400 [Patescibacteria group bacterium]
MLEKKIIREIEIGNNVILVGPADAGKTYFVENCLIPKLRKMSIPFIFFFNCEEVDSNKKTGVLIIDEVEILFDQDFLQKLHPDELPYYSDDYLKKVKGWHKKLSKLDGMVLGVVTRNKREEIDNIVQNLKYLEWNNKLAIGIEFKI